MNVIRFYKVTDPYGALSNFAPYPIRIGSKVWPTTEHYFQAQKFAGTAYEETIRMAVSPMQAAELGRSRNQKLRRDWESVKETIMEQALWAKFQQHPALINMLIGTGNAKLIENSPGDSYWGDGGNGSGRNRLGELLMKIRTRLLTGSRTD